MIAIGIDPGKKGCVTLLKQKQGCKEIVFYDMPLNKKGETKSINAKALFDFLLTIKDKNKDGCFCFIEKAQVMPNQGSRSGLTIGIGYGKLTTVLEILEIDFKEIRPVEWKNEFDLNIKRDKTKDAKTKKKEKKLLTAKRACELYPNLKKEFYTKRNSLMDGRTDSLLIAEYCFRKKTNNIFRKKRKRK